MMHALVEATGDRVQLVDTIVRASAELFDAFCGVALVSDDGTELLPVAVFEQDPLVRALLEPLTGSRPFPVNGPLPASLAVREARTILTAHVDPSWLAARFPPAELPAITALGIHSALAVPLRAYGLTIGVLSLLRHGETPTLDEDDARLARTLADFAALTLANARLHAKERLARELATHAEARFRALLEHASDGVALASPSGTVLYRSPAAVRMLGGHPDDAQGGPIKAIHPDDLAVFRETLDAVLADPARPCAMTIRARHADGSWRWLETITTNLVAGAGHRRARHQLPRRDGAPGDARGAAGERGALPAHRRDHERGGVDGGRRRADHVRQRAHGHHAGVRRPERTPRCRFGEVPARGGSRRRRRRGGATRRIGGQVEARLVRRDGEIVWVLVESTPILGEAGEGQPRPFEGILLMVMDVCARKRAEDERGRLTEALASTEEQLRQAQKMEAIGALAGGIAHDFNNLLTGIISYAHFALEAARKGESVSEDVTEIEKAARSAAQLTRQLLAFSRQQVLSPRVLDLDEILLQLEKMLRRVLGEDVELRYLSDGEPHRCKVDPGQIEQVIMNLAINARDAMPNGGKLTLELCATDLDRGYADEHLEVTAGPHVMLAVTDTGVGMDAVTVARIFEPFFTTKEQGKGTGLGLSTVFGIIKQSGGHLWVYSEPGLGSSFKVYLPAVEAPIVPPRAEARGRPLQGHETILLVEDDPQVRAVLRTILRRAGYEVLEAPGGEQALLTSREHAGRIHLLVTDLVMPGMNGREVAERVEAERPGLKVLYMSGYTGNTLGLVGAIDEGVAFLQKPITPTDLLTKVREVLDP
ncbi:MAG: response regulator [Myxococcales bacterium]|nr:response regulator [Myxococcales bacterium]